MIRQFPILYIVISITTVFLYTCLFIFSTYNKLAVTRCFTREYLTFNKYFNIIFIVYVYMAFCPVSYTHLDVYKRQP